ncbi:Uncharacterized protein SCF082_LOCUS33199 [Durusdinium trenchii]|uniref:C2H2-type domain-containing protein n=1 Tax=Durusdinium trenchii TaxID=1381693 RepID=A0ABP0NN01_9DINO
MASQWTKLEPWQSWSDAWEEEQRDSVEVRCSASLTRRQKKRRRDRWYRTWVWKHAREFTSTSRYRKSVYNRYFESVLAEFQDTAKDASRTAETNAQEHPDVLGGSQSPADWLQICRNRTAALRAREDRERRPRRTIPTVETLLEQGWSLVQAEYFVTSLTRSLQIQYHIRIWDQAMPPCIAQRFSRQTGYRRGIRIPLPPEGFDPPVLPAQCPEDTVSLSEKLWLQRCHEHPRDQQVQFQSDGHKYFVDGREIELSAFDADITIQRMQRSSYWPRPKYLKNVKSTYAYEMVEQEAGLNELDPLRQLLQLEEIPLDKLLFDWKRTKDLPSKYSNQWQSLMAPLSHLPDATGVKYRLQLNTYRYIVEKYYGMIVDAMYVVCLHPEQPEEPWIDEVPFMYEEINLLMQHRREVCARGAAEQDVQGGASVHIRSALTGEILTLLPVHDPLASACDTVRRGLQKPYFTTQVCLNGRILSTEESWEMIGLPEILDVIFVPMHNRSPREFFAAIREGDDLTVRKLLEEGQTANVWSGDCSSLAYCCMYGESEDVACTLVLAGDTPLSLARDFAEVSAVLMDHCWANTKMQHLLACMREACGLPPRDVRVATSRINHIINIDQPEEETEVDKKWKSAHEGLITFMLENKKAVASAGALRLMKCRDGPPASKDELLSGLVDMGMCLKVPGRLKAESCYIPLLHTERKLQDIIHHQDRMCEEELPERYDTEAFYEYVFGHAFRRDNASILATVLTSVGSRKGTRGRKTADEQRAKEEASERAAKLEAAEANSSQLLDKMFITERPTKRAKEEQGLSVYKRERNCRTYSQCSQMFDCKLLPVLMAEKLSLGKWVLHIENNGLPHCVGLEVQDDDKVLLWDVDGCFQLSMSDFTRAMAEGVDRATSVIYALNPDENMTALGLALTNEDVEQLLDLAAGTTIEKDEEEPDQCDTFVLRDADDDVNTDTEAPHELQWLNGEGCVTVERSLLQTLEAEVQGYIEAAKKGKLRSRGGKIFCPACPFRSFERSSRVAAHLQKYHNAKNQFCCSGTKQLRMILAFHIDKHIRLLLDASGPRFVHQHAVDKQLLARRVGNLWMTHAFAEVLFQEILVNHAKVKTTWPRFMMRAVAQENSLANLLPTHTSSWWPMVEDIFSAPATKEIIQSIQQRAIGRDEYTYLSIDGTFRVCFGVLGQAKFNDPAAVQQQFPFHGADAFARVISIKGRTGAVVGLLPAAGEGPEEIATCITTALPPQALHQVKHVSVDAPSASLVEELRKVLPSLQGVSLDATHIAMRYEQSSGSRKTQGSMLLRKCLHKFQGHDPRLGSDVWGPMFAGKDARRLSAQEEGLRSQILTGKMSGARASRVLVSIEELQVWPTRIQFIEALAALSSTYFSEMGRKLEGRMLTVGRMLYTATAPDKLEWLFNILRHRHNLCATTRMLMPSGTTSNEALHAELNLWFRQIQSVHRSTFQLKLQIIQFSKLWTHDSALHAPTTRQMTNIQILARKVGHPLWSKNQWKQWVQGQRERGGGARENLKLTAQRVEESKKIRKGVMKRPSSASRKRTPFTLPRELGVSRAGMYRRRPARDTT